MTHIGQCSWYGFGVWWAGVSVNSVNYMMKPVLLLEGMKKGKFSLRQRGRSNLRSSHTHQGNHSVHKTQCVSELISSLVYLRLCESDVWAYKQKKLMKTSQHFKRYEYVNTHTHDWNTGCSVKCVNVNLLPLLELLQRTHTHFWAVVKSRLCCRQSDHTHWFSFQMG